MDIFKAYAAISKVDDEQRMVYGYASTDTKDSQGDIVKLDAIEAALPDYMKFANIREMHTMSAVGVAKSAEVDDKGLYLAAKVVDDDAWKKVKEGVYKGFSIGGKALKKAGGVIEQLRLTEISLVDRPANSECVIDMWKAEGGDDAQEQSAQQPIAKALNEYTADELRDALAKAEQAAAAAAAKAAADAATQEVTKADAPAPSFDDIAKAASYEDGKPIWDSCRAMSAMESVFYLMMSEAAEKVQEPAQLAMLQAAIDSLKAFVIAELQEPAAPINVAMGDGIDNMDILKAGAKFSKSTKDALAKMHGLIRECAKGFDEMGYDKDGDDDTAKADGTVVLVGADEELRKACAAAGLTVADDAQPADLAKAAVEALNKSLTRVAELEAQPAKAPATTVVSKGDDTAGNLTKSAPQIDPNDPLGVFKAVLSQPLAVGM
jgi:HK97 family phage prohead protease